MNNFILNNINNKIDFLTCISDRINNIVQGLAATQPKPIKDKIIIDGHRVQVYNYKLEDKNEKLAVFLKTIRLAKITQAAIHILKSNFSSKSLILSRAAQEEVEDIIFLYYFHNMSNHFKILDKYSRINKSILDTFFCNDSDKNLVRRKDVQEAINDIQQDTNNSLGKTYHHYSRFTHSNCIAIINVSYNDREQKYNIKESELLTEDLIDNFFDELYRVTISLELGCKFLKNNFYEEEARKLKICYKNILDTSYSNEN